MYNLQNTARRRCDKNLDRIPDRAILYQDNNAQVVLRINYLELERFLIMERIKTIATRDLTKSVKTGGCGECQTSCQSACKTSCGVANQQCENSNK